MLGKPSYPKPRDVLRRGADSVTGDILQRAKHKKKMAGVFRELATSGYKTRTKNIISASPFSFFFIVLEGINRTSIGFGGFGSRKYSVLHMTDAVGRNGRSRVLDARVFAQTLAKPDQL